MVIFFQNPYLEYMRLFLFILLFINSLITTAQGRDTAAIKEAVDAINRLLDRAVVAKDKAILEKHYADDFFFRHGTGALDNKQSWIAYVLRPDHQYLSREHDSVEVELHGDVAIVAGTLTVKRQQGAYVLRYSRLYAWRKKRWQLVSHRTFVETHL